MVLIKDEETVGTQVYGVVMMMVMDEIIGGEERQSLRGLVRFVLFFAFALLI
jgi:hypothetical protein